MTPYKLLADGIYECQADDCTQEATHVWPRTATPEELAEIPQEHRQRLGEAHLSVMSCPAHAVQTHAQARLHRRDCPAPNPGCDCTWED